MDSVDLSEEGTEPTVNKDVYLLVPNEVNPFCSLHMNAVLFSPIGIFSSFG